jgi:O-acetyl-ADP-ribose deacetylase (regulator of RNase III)
MDFVKKPTVKFNDIGVTLYSLLPNPPQQHSNILQRIKIYKGDITLIRVDAIVNPANAFVVNGTGLTGLIFQKSCADSSSPLKSACINASGRENKTMTKSYTSLNNNTTESDYKETLTLNPGAVGRGCYITPAFRLPSKYIIHVAGPNNGAGGSEIEKKFKKELLEKSYTSCLIAANEHSDIYTIAFCSISTGIFAYPIGEASKIAMQTVYDFLKTNNKLTCLFCLYDDKDYGNYKGAITDIKLE